MKRQKAQGKRLPIAIGKTKGKGKSRLIEIEMSVQRRERMSYKMIKDRIKNI